MKRYSYMKASKRCGDRKKDSEKYTSKQNLCSHSVLQQIQEDNRQAFLDKFAEFRLGFANSIESQITNRRVASLRSNVIVLLMLV